ncbi:MAG: hypothetical protein ABJK28_07575 [Algibacter sp.]
MIKVIDNQIEWDTCLLEMDSYDFYHSFEYHQTLKNKEEELFLVVYDEDNIKIAIPFLKRKINSKFYDLTSVHGYLGPVSKNVPENFDNSRFKTHFDDLLKKEHIVSVFSKLNPYIQNQKEIINSLGDVENIGEVIYFNQEEAEEEQIKCYGRNTRQRLNQLKKMCTIKYASSEEEISSFIKLYHENMDRLEAKRVFYFQQEYFNTLLNSNILDAKIILAIHNTTKDIMGGVFCVGTKEIMHVELACTNPIYFKNSPVRILFDSSRLFYKNNTVKYLNLGGGTGGREGSLMQFKSSFSQNYVDFNVWKYIVSPDIYISLIPNEQKESNSDFFPKYRLNH